MAYSVGHERGIGARDLWFVAYGDKQHMFTGESVFLVLPHAKSHKLFVFLCAFVIGHLLSASLSLFVPSAIRYKPFALFYMR
jgi:hypothetical protein